MSLSIIIVIIKLVGILNRLNYNVKNLTDYKMPDLHRE